MGLLDIAPGKATSETLVVAGQELEVRGVGNSALASIMRRFPEFGKVFSGVSHIKLASISEKAAKEAGIPYDPDAAFEASLLMQEAMPALIAAGCGHANDSRYEAAAERLDPADQTALLDAIMRLTQPKVPRPLADAAGADPQPQSSGDATQAENLPPQSSS